MLIVYVSAFALLFGTLRAQEESSLESEDLDITTMEPKGFKFKPEVLRKFRIVLKRIFNFDRLFNTPPNALFKFPQDMRRPDGQQASQFSNSLRSNNDREFLEETAEVPETNQHQQGLYDQRRRYEQYWRDYYYRQQQQQQYSPYGNQQNILYGPQQNYNYQQQQYSPYGNQNYQYNQQTPYNQYYQQQQQYGGQYGNQQGFSLGSGLNIGLPNGLGFGMNSGMGLNLGK